MTAAERALNVIEKLWPDTVNECVRILKEEIVRDQAKPCDAVVDDMRCPCELPDGHEGRHSFSLEWGQ